MQNQRGQSLVEILIAVGIFSIVVSAISFLILDAYTANRSGGEISQATFLAQEGLEAVKSIRDNDWGDLETGTHGIVEQGNTWRLQLNNPDDLSSLLTNGLRSIIIEDLDVDTKKITAQVSWDFSEARSQNISLITYLTNWQKQGSYCGGTSLACSNFDELTCLDQEGCSITSAFCDDDPYCTPCTGLGRNRCNRQDGCFWWWRNRTCYNNPQCTQCGNYSNPPDENGCDNQLGCTWNPAGCNGEPTSCAEYNNSTDCGLQTGCNWIIP